MDVLEVPTPSPRGLTQPGHGRHFTSALASGFAEVIGRALSFLFFVVLARCGGPDLFGVIRAALSAGQIGAGLGVPYLTALSRLAGAPTDSSAARDHAGAELRNSLSGWWISSLVGAIVASVAFGWSEGAGPAVFLGSLGFACNYLGVLLAKSRRMPGTLLAISVWGNLGQLAVLWPLAVMAPRHLTPGLVITIYSCAFIAPVLIAPRLRPLLQVPHLAIRSVWAGLRRADYWSFLAQHISHTLVINLDVLVLARVASASAVGGFAAVKTVMVVVLLPATSLFHLLIPASLRRLRHHTDPGDWQVRWLAIAGVTLGAAATALWSPSLLRLVYGVRFAGLGRALLLAAIGAWGYGLALIEGARWIAAGRTASFSALVSLSAVGQAIALLTLPGLATAEGAALTWAWSNALLLGVVQIAPLIRRREATA